MSDQETDRDDSKTAAIAAAVLGAILSVAAASLYDGKTAMSVALGAAIAVANLLTMRAIVRAILQSPEDDEKKDERDHKDAGRRGGAAWGVFAVLKLFILFGGIWLLLTKGLVAPIPLVVGYGVLPLGIAAAGVWNGMKTRR